MRTIRAGGMQRIDVPDFFERAIAPRMVETPYGRALLSVRAAMAEPGKPASGWARTWKLAPWIQYGESLPRRETRDYAETRQREEVA